MNVKEFLDLVRKEAIVNFVNLLEECNKFGYQEIQKKYENDELFKAKVRFLDHECYYDDEFLRTKQLTWNTRYSIFGGYDNNYIYKVLQVILEVQSSILQKELFEYFAEELKNTKFFSKEENKLLIVTPWYHSANSIQMIRNNYCALKAFSKVVNFKIVSKVMDCSSNKEVEQEMLIDEKNDNDWLRVKTF